MNQNEIEIRQVDDYRWEIPKQGNMLVPGKIFADKSLMKDIFKDQCIKQVANVAMLPGIIGESLAMPDIHWGYGFAIGGVAAMDMDNGVISPGGVGYDINCGVRMLRTSLSREEIQPYIRKLVAGLYSSIPTGVGSKSDLNLSIGEMKKVLENGAKWAVEHGFGSETDLERIEENGRMTGANPDNVSKRAIERGRRQIGTLGSGNHFLEIAYVDEIYDETAAKAFGLFLNGVTVTIHTGSRGLGHQVCDDFLRVMSGATSKYGINIPDRQLACAPVKSKEGMEYFGAMAAAANFAWANRQAIMEWTRETLSKILNKSYSDLKMDLVYDVCHNIAKFEEHEVEGRIKKVCVHRKGATRALPAGHSQTPGIYKKIGQPVLIPGDMGRYSFIMSGTDLALKETFGSACHGAGRVMSRKQAIKISRNRSIYKELENKGIIVQSHGKQTMHEEISEAYKDVQDVVEVVHRAGIANKVARMRPMGVIKG